MTPERQPTNPMKEDFLGRLGGKHGVLDFEIITGKQGTSNAGDFCKYCIIDAVNRYDNRPQVLPGCDCRHRLENELGGKPSAGHDWIDEVLGLLRVARQQRDDAEAQLAKFHSTPAAVQTAGQPVA